MAVMLSGSVFRMTGKDKREVKRIIFEYFEYIESEWDKFEEKKQ